MNGCIAFGIVAALLVALLINLGITAWNFTFRC